MATRAELIEVIRRREDAVKVVRVRDLTDEDIPKVFLLLTPRSLDEVNGGKHAQVRAAGMWMGPEEMRKHPDYFGRVPVDTGTSWYKFCKVGNLLALVGKEAA